MIIDSFKNLKFFKESEFSHPEKMNPSFLLRLDAFRGYVNSEAIITSSTEGNHAENSEHYRGNAVDIIFPHARITISGLWMIAERFGFHGIGIYPHWAYNGVTLGGLHLDERELVNFQGARWLGVLKNGIQTYEPMTIKNLKDYKIFT